MKLVQQTRSAALFAILYLALPICALADDARDEIKKCARIADDSVRIACYEELGSRILGERATDSHADGIVPAGDRVEDDSEVPVAGDTLADGFGGEEFARKTQDYEAANRGRVTSCRQGPDRKWSFFLKVVRYGNSLTDVAIDLGNVTT